MNSQIEQFIKQLIAEKREIKYIKNGSRHGWIGRITQLNLSLVIMGMKDI